MDGRRWDTKMKIASKKRKASLLQNLVRDKILKNFPHLKFRDVKTASNGQTGSDLLLSNTAQKLVGWNFEVKNQNKMKTIYDWYKQSTKHCKNTKLKPCVAMKMNSRMPLIVLDLDDFMDLIKN